MQGGRGQQGWKSNRRDGRGRSLRRSPRDDTTAPTRCNVAAVALSCRCNAPHTVRRYRTRLFPFPTGLLATSFPLRPLGSLFLLRSPCARQPPSSRIPPRIRCLGYRASLTRDLARGLGVLYGIRSRLRGVVPPPLRFPLANGANPPSIPAIHPSDIVLPLPLLTRPSPPLS